MEEYTIVNLIGDIFKFIFNFIGNIFKFGFNLIKGYCVFTAKSVDFIASIFGINSFGIKIVISVLYTYLLSLIPDLITYFGCTLKKEYRNLKTKEEKQEYRSKHTYFLLRLILGIKNKVERKKAEKFEDKTEGKVDKINYGDSINLDNLINKIEKEKTSNNNNNNKINKNNNNYNNYNNYNNNNYNNNTVKEELVQTEEYTNVKLVKGENVVGNMMRNGVVLERRFSASNKPMLIKFENVPTELYTNHLLNRNSGVRYKNKNIELNFDDPEFLKRTDLYENLTIEQLKLLKEQIEQDKNYKLGLSSFFTINDKVMSLSKKM